MANLTPRQETAISGIVREVIERWLKSDPNDSFVTANNAVDFAVVEAVDRIDNELNWD